MTPLVKVDNFYLKREDYNTTGSVKDRAIELQIQHLLSQGYSSAVISSTGNAAISAQHFCQLYQVKLTIFVSPNIHPSKLKLLHHYHLSPKPISDAIKYAKSNQSYLLRQSTDPTAIQGYNQIATEILQQLPQVTSLYFPVGSGATLIGVCQHLPPSIKIFAVQSAFNPIITRQFSPFVAETTNLTDALTVKYLPLKHQILQRITSGFTIQNSQITLAKNFLTSHQITTSNEGALALAAFQQNPNLGGLSPVIILTGSQR